MIIKTIPISVNKMYRGRRFLTSEGKANKEALAWEVRTQYRGRPLEGSICLTVAFYYPKRNRDIDGGLKSLLDACTGILWVDDSQIEELHITMSKDKNNPRVEMEIK